MASTARCSKCGAPVSDEVAGGFCTACLLEEGLAPARRKKAPITLKHFGPIADAERGKFRTFLFNSWKNSLINEWQKARTVKQGSGQSFFPLEFDNAQQPHLADPASDLTPERLFEKSLAVTVVERARARLREEWAATNKLSLFDQLQEHIWGKWAETYTELAAQLNTTERALRIAAHRMRGRFRTLVREEVAQMVQTPDEVDAKLRYLVSLLRT